MKVIGRRFLLWLSLLAIVTVVGLPATATTAKAQDNVAGTPPRTITVVGEGTVSISPDVARATIGVEVTKPSVQEASAENRAVLEAVLEALRDQGIDDSDIQTSGFSVYAERFGPEGPLDSNQVTYRVANNVSVEIRDLNNVGSVLDAAIEAGANNIYGVDFSLEEASAAQSEARAAAVANAAAKAQELADLAGVTLGPIISLSEVIGQNAALYLGVSSRVQGLGGGGGAPISPGELEIVNQIQAVYAIE